MGSDSRWGRRRSLRKTKIFSDLDPFEAGVAPAKLGQIEMRRHIALAVGQHQVGVTLQSVRTQRRVLDARHRGKDLEHADQDGDVAGGVLPDHVEHRVDEPVVIDGRHRKRGDSIAQVDAGRQEAGRELAERRGQPVEHAHCRVRVVDARRERARRDLDQLTHGVGEIAAADPRVAERRRVANRGGCARMSRLDEGDRCAGKT